MWRDGERTLLIGGLGSPGTTTTIRDNGAPETGFPLEEDRRYTVDMIETFIVYSKVGSNSFGFENERKIFILDQSYSNSMTDK